MTERLYTPPHYVDIHDSSPAVFLAGPVQGAPDWQTPLADDLLRQNDDIIVFSPRRNEVDQQRFDADEQKDWEFVSRDRTRLLGVTAFWWEAQDPGIAYPQGRAYAQTTRIEMGMTLGWRTYDPTVSIVVGFDPMYTKKGGGSERYLRSACEASGIPVTDSREGLVNEILREVENLTR